MELHDSINFEINGELRKIELYLGDITMLNLPDKVDVLLVSAFPSNYIPISGTLIGALLNNLRISVKDLAKDKGEDLRKDFHCWISKPLPETIPYKRILCFEQGKQQSNVMYYENPAALVGEVFRALFTTFKNEDWTLITPILATGNQGSDKKTMIKAMVKSCASWIIAGMQLKCMKIVIYQGNLNSFIGKYDQEAIGEFAKLKAEMNWKPFIDKIIDVKNDVLFLFTKEDKDLVKPFIKSFTDSTIEENRIIDAECINQSNEQLNESIKFQFQEKMVQTKKIVLFLTPTFLTTSQAVELYNLALCLTHKTRRNLLTPVYLLNIDNLPEYMTLNQWIDCRLKSTDDILETKLFNGCQLLINILKESDSHRNNKILSSKAHQTKTILNLDDQSTKECFDIFISYCHKDSQIANIILSFLRISLPNIKIFFDVSGLKSGYSWQETLYYGINNSKIILSLLSENYLQSAMCCEEFSLAISQHQSPKYTTNLLSIWISDIDIQDENIRVYWKSFAYIQNILVPKFSTYTSMDKNLKIISFCQELLNSYINPILLQKKFRVQSSIMPVIDLEEAALKARMSFFKSTWPLKTFNTHPCNIKSNINNSQKLSIDINIAFHEDDLAIAQLLKSFLFHINENLKVKFSPVGQQILGYKDFTDFENVNLIIILLNPYYISSKSCLNQLQIALSLQRRQSESGFKICPLIMESLPSEPSYIHLLPSRFKAGDEIYQEILNKFKNSDQLNKIIQFHHHGSIKNNIITSKTQVMLYFVASWVGENSDLLFATKTPVIYSTYDLMITNFNEPRLDDTFDENKQIESIEISDENIKCGKQFMYDHISVVKNSGAKIHNASTHSLNQYKLIVENSHKTIATTKVCLIM